MSYVNNPQVRRAHEKFGASPEPEPAMPEDKPQGGKHPHSVHIHHAGPGEPRAANPHHVHVHHGDGSHQHSDHGSFDEAMQHVKSMSSEGAGEAAAPVNGGDMDDGY